MTRISLRKFLLFFLVATVIGYAADRILDHLAEKDAQQFLTYLINEDYENSNKMIVDEFSSRAKWKIWRELKKKVSTQSMAKRLEYENPDPGFQYLSGNSKLEKSNQKFYPYNQAIKRLYDESLEEYFRPIKRVDMDPLSSSIPRPNGSSIDLLRNLGWPTIQLPESHSLADKEEFGRKISSHGWLQKANNDLVEQFAAKYRLGVYESREKVIGFVPHRLQVPMRQKSGAIPSPLFLSHLAYGGANSSTGIFELKGLSLISGRDGGPFVFQSNKLPNFKDLSSEKSRPLNKFEQEAWSKMKEGKEIVVRADGTQWVVAGPIRAKHWCRKCHATEAGQLMGAFSYRLSSTISRTSK